MVALSRFCKTPTERLDYEISFARWMAEDDAITAAGATIEDGTVSVDDIEFDQGLVRVWLVGGELEELNRITVTASTLEGREKEYAFEVHIKEA